MAGMKALAVVVLLAAVFGAGWLAAGSGVGRAVDPASLTDRERAFAESMQDVVLEGFFTVEGRETPDDHPERYEIAQVVKVNDNNWRFDARITYASVDVTLPVTLPIVWAGDTPMISITDFEIPTLGTFTVRLLFYSNRYAGSWQHGEFGGVMYGTIARR